MMATSGNNQTKNPKTRKIKQLMDKRKRNVTQFWVPGHAKRALEESISNDKNYPPEDLGECIKTEMAGIRQRRWKEGEKPMKERKKNPGWQNNTEKLKRRD
jgi:hypothetical protein